jgi:transposase-like protein
MAISDFEEASRVMKIIRHFDQEIIVLCVRWYLTFKLQLP